MSSFISSIGLVDKKKKNHSGQRDTNIKKKKKK